MSRSTATALPTPASPAAADTRATARDVYVYGFPLVDNYRILHSYFVDHDQAEFRAPWNQIHNTARVFTPDDKAVQTPNADTRYTTLGADLRAEPLIVTLPPVDPSRDVSAQFIDLYTFNFAYAGSRSTGSGGADASCSRDPAGTVTRAASPGAPRSFGARRSWRWYSFGRSSSHRQTSRSCTSRAGRLCRRTLVGVSTAAGAPATAAD